MQTIETLNPSVQQYLTFRLEGAEYAIDVQVVQELRAQEETSPCPDAPQFVQGVINLRGVIVPIINLRRYFALPERDGSLTTAVIVINLPGENVVLGLVVDAVSDVHGIAHDQLRSASNQAGLMVHAFILGLATRGQETIAVLDIHRLIHQGILSAEVENKCELETEALYA